MPEISSGNKRIARNTAFLYFRMIVVLVVALYTTRVVLRVLGVVDYGIYNVVAGFVSMFAFLKTSLVNAAQRFYNYETSKNGKEGRRKVYSTALVIHAFFALVILLLLETFGLWYVNNVLVVPPDRIVAANWLFQFSSVSSVLVIMQVPHSAVIASAEKMDYLAIVTVIVSFLRLLIAIVLPYVNTDRLIFYGFLILCVEITGFLMYFIYAKKKFVELKYEKPVSWDLLKEMLTFSGWNVFGTFAGMMKTQGLNMLINFFFGPAINAARGIASQMMSALQGFSLNIVAAFRPQLVGSYAQNNFDRTRNIMFAESKICYSLVLTLLVPLIVEIDYVLNLWLGSEIPDYTPIFSFLVLLIMLVGTLNTPLTQVVHATGNLKVYLLVTSIINCLIVPVSWIFLRLGFSPTSVFVVSFVMTIINQIASVFIVRNIFPFSLRYYLRSIVIPCLVMTVCLPILPLLLRYTMNVGFARLVVVCVSDLLIAFLLFFYVVLAQSERKMAFQMIKEYAKRKKK